MTTTSSSSPCKYSDLELSPLLSSGGDVMGLLFIVVFSVGFSVAFVSVLELLSPLLPFVGSVGLLFSVEFSDLDVVSLPFVSLVGVAGLLFSVFDVVSVLCCLSSFEDVVCLLVFVFLY